MRLGRTPEAWVQEDSWPTEQFLAGLYVLDGLKGVGPKKFQALFEAEVSPRALIERPDELPITGKTGEKIRQGLRDLTETARSTGLERARKQIEAAQRAGAAIITYGHPAYPRVVYESNYPVAVLYVLRGWKLLRDARAVACVGSRAIRAPYDELHRGFSEAACDAGFSVASGFALGADTIGHRVAYEAGAVTICVMPCGLDRPFPPENRALWRSFVDYDRAVLVSEFPFGMGASSLALRKRNKLIVGFSRGVLVSQSSAKGGAMNAYRFAREQKKPIAVFRSDGEPDTSGNQQITGDLRAEDRAFELSAGQKEFRSWLRTL